MISKKVLVLAAALMGVSTMACSDKIEPGTTDPAPGKTLPAVVGVVRISQEPFIYEAVGNVQAQTFSTLSSKLMGTVTHIRVKEGDKVSQGDALIKIDDREVTARLRQARAALSEAQRGLDAAVSARETARAGAKLAAATFKRYEQLMAEDSASQQEFDEVTARHQKAQAAVTQAGAMVAAATNRVQQAEAGLSTAHVMEKDVTIKAPYDGIITAKLVDVGDMASPGSPLLHLEGKGVYEVSLTLPELYLQSIKLGQKVTVSIPALGKTDLSAVVETIAPTADMKTRSFKIKLLLEPYDAVRSGMFARVNIPVGESGIVTLPATAILQRGQLNGFFLVDDQQRVHFRLVRVGRRLGDRWEILSGVKDGVRYVSDPPLNMVDGDMVEVGS